MAMGARRFVLAGMVLGAMGGGALAGSVKRAQHRVEIAVVQEGFAPASITVKKNEPVTLVFTRKTEETCAKQVLVYLSPEQKVEKTLPLGEPVEIAAVFTTSGALDFTCKQGHVAGVINVR